MCLETELNRVDELAGAPAGRCLKNGRGVSRWGGDLLTWMVAVFVLLALSRARAEDGEGKTTSARETLIKIATNKHGVATLLFVENVQSADVTVTFEMELVNLGADVAFPFTTTLAPKSRVKAFTLTPIDRTRGWSWTYTYYSTFGSTQVKHDDSCIYWLPYAPGKSYRISQGYNGDYSHFGADEYAIDWRMPIGSAIYAARGGIVVGVKGDSNVGGNDRKYDWDANYVLIRHPDGTLGQYVHLMKDGIPVEIGQAVRAGDFIGFSGNTGHSTGPHLHFSVFKARDGKHRQTIPVRYRTADQVGVTLAEGLSYKAPESPTPAALLAGNRASTPDPVFPEAGSLEGGSAQGATAVGH